MRKSVLAIDGGGTKTAALVVNVLGQVHALRPSTGCNPQDGAAAHLAALARAGGFGAGPWCHAGSVFKSARITAALTRDLGPSVASVASALAWGLAQAAALAQWDVSADWTRRVMTQVQDL